MKYKEINNKLQRGLALTVKESQDLYQYIKALEQEPCEDAISRQAVDILVDELARAISDERCCISRGRSTATIMQDILELPPVTPQPKTGWIPVSERLPKDGQNVLFCDIDDDIMVGYHVKGKPDTHFTQDGTFEDMKNIKAWRPLPQSYKAESEEQDADSN